MVKIAGSTPPEDQNFLKWKEPDKIERVQRRNKFTQRTGSNQNIERARKKITFDFVPNRLQYSASRLRH